VEQSGEEMSLNFKQRVLCAGDIVINREVENQSTAFLHNLSSCKAFPSLAAFPLDRIRAFLEQDRGGLGREASSVRDVYDEATRLGAGIPPNNLMIWLKVYRTVLRVGRESYRTTRMWTSPPPPPISLRKGVETSRGGLPKEGAVRRAPRAKKGSIQERLESQKKVQRSCCLVSGRHE
jgi:hypothetical protein